MYDKIGPTRQEIALVETIDELWQESKQERAWRESGEDEARCHTIKLGEWLSQVLALLLLMASGNKPFGKPVLLAALAFARSRASMPAYYLPKLLERFQTSTPKRLA